MKTTGYFLVLVAQLAALALAAESHGQNNPEPVEVVFQNPPESNPVRFRLRSEAQATNSEPVFLKLADDDTPLKPGNQRTFSSYPGMVWQILDDNSNKELTQFVAGATDRQVVNIGELITWNAPVTLKFTNTTEAPISVFRVDNQNALDFLTLTVAGEYAGASVSVSLMRVPGDRFRLKFSNGDERELQLDSEKSKLVPSDRSQQSPENELVFTVEKGAVKGFSMQGQFYKRTAEAFSGILEIENLPVGKTGELKTGDGRRPPLPGTLYRIVQDGKFYAEYISDNNSIQEIDVKERGTWFVEVTIVFQNDSSFPVAVYYLDPVGKPIPIMIDKKEFVLPLDPNNWVAQPARPFYQFRVVNKKDRQQFIDFDVDNQKEQIFSITDELLKSKS